MKKTPFILLLLALTIPVLHLVAEPVNFSTSTSKKVYYDFERILLTYKIENADYKGVQVPQSPDFQVVNNSVSSSSSRSITIINGKRVSQGGSTYEVTFELKANKKGIIKIPQALMQYEGKTYRSPSFNVEVTSLDVSQKEASKDRFIKTEVSNMNPYVGQGFTITYTLFTVDEITDGNQLKNAGQFKNFGPFSAKDLEGMTNSRVSLNGRNYLLLVLQKHLLVPIKPGKFKVPSHTLKYVTYQYVNRGFFRTRGAEVPHAVQAPAVTINVKALPAAPADFSGLVGKFSLKSKQDKKELLINDALTVKYEISGRGNFSALKELPLSWNKSWEVFEPKSINGYQVSGNTYVGKVTKEYVAIPRSNGKQAIPGLSFSYFDLASKKYKRLSVNEKSIEVTGEEDLSTGNVVYNGSGQHVEIQASDIRYLSEEWSFSQGVERAFFGSVPHHVLSVSLGLASLFFLVFYKPKQESHADQIHKKKKRAFKKAKAVLKDAEKALNSDDKEFYGKNELSMNHYFMDKFNILPQDFNEEVLKESLLKFNLSEQRTQEVLKLHGKCGMARYSPIGVSKSEVFNEVKEMITELG